MVEYIKSDFNGILPQHYINNTWEIPPNMNDMNLEEVSRYV